MQIKVEKLNLVKLSCIYLVYEGLWLQAPTPFAIPKDAIQRNARNSWSNICRYGSTPTSRELQLQIYNNKKKILHLTLHCSKPTTSGDSDLKTLAPAHRNINKKIKRFTFPY